MASAEGAGQTTEHTEYTERRRGMCRKWPKKCRSESTCGHETEFSVCSHGSPCRATDRNGNFMYCRSPGRLMRHAWGNQSGYLLSPGGDRGFFSISPKNALNTAACLTKPASLGWIPSTVPSPSSPNMLRLERKWRFVIPSACR
jgi:hypothetical protein